MIGLTPKQAEAKAIIEKYAARHRSVPTYRKLAALLGHRTSSCAYRTVEELVRRGHARFTNAPRSNFELIHAPVSRAPDGEPLFFVPIGGETFDCSTRDLEAARRDAMKAMVVGLPDPHQVAAYLETAYPEAAETLRSAWIGKVQPYAGAWRVEDNEHVSTLRAIGLVGWASKSDGCLVGAFGNKVRQIMLCDWEEGDE